MLRNITQMQFCTLGNKLGLLETTVIQARATVGAELTRCVGRAFWFGEGSSCGTRSTAATRSMWRTAGGPLAVQESVDSKPRCAEAFVQNHSSSSLIWVSLSSPAKTARGAGHRDRTRQRPDLCQQLAVIGGQPALDQLPAPSIQPARDHRSCVHIQTTLVR